MAYIFTPLIVDFGKIALKETKTEDQETQETTEMDFGTHVRLLGSETIKRLTVPVVVDRHQLLALSEFKKISRGKIFYSTYPDQDDPEIIKGQYYAFSYGSTAWTKEKKGNHSYEIELDLLWHMMIPPTSRA